MEKTGLYQALLQKQEPLTVGVKISRNTENQDEDLLKAIVEAVNFTRVGYKTDIVIMVPDMLATKIKVKNYIYRIINSLQNDSAELQIDHDDIDENNMRVTIFTDK